MARSPCNDTLGLKLVTSFLLISINYSISCLSENEKMIYPQPYFAKKGPIMQDLELTWGVDPNFQGSNHADYRIIHNEHGVNRTS